MKKLLMIVMLLFVSPAFAGPDEGLYDPKPPEGSAFVRLISLNPNAEPVMVNGRVHPDIKYGEMTPYFPCIAGPLVMSIGVTDLKGETVAGKFYTAIVKGAEVTVLEDAAHTDPTKAQISLYNLGSDLPLLLKTGDGETDIIDLTLRNSNGSRQINPVSVHLTVYRGMQALSDLGEVSLERGVSYSVVFLDPKNVAWIRNSTDMTP